MENNIPVCTETSANKTRKTTRGSGSNNATPSPVTDDGVASRAGLKRGQEETPIRSGREEGEEVMEETMKWGARRQEAR